MPRNGTGTYTLPAGNPVVTGTSISSTVHNSTMSDIATAITSSISKDGQTVPTNNLPMGGFKHTNVDAATSDTDYARYDQVVTPSELLGTSSIEGGNMVGFLATGTGAVDRTVQAKLRESFISVKDYGAVGDGITDDTTAINNALKAIRGNLTGQILLFPYGTYLTTGLIVYPDSHIVFDPGATLKMSADGVGIKTRNPSTQTYVIYNIPRVIIENLQIDMAGHDGFGLLLEGVTHASIVNPKITNVGSGSYTYNDGFGNDSYSTTGIVLKGVHGVHGAYYNRIINPRVEGISTTGGVGIYLGTTVSGYSQRANFNYIELPVCTGLSLGIEINIGGDNVIVQPECSINTVGIRIGRASGTYDAVRNTIRRPYLENCSSVGILLRALATDTVIDGFGGTSGTATPYTDNGVNTAIFAGNTDSIATTGYARFYKYSIRFSPAVANTDKDTNANALDDYEEGTFTPAISGSTSAGTGTYTVQQGDYTLIGDRCFFNAYLTWTAHTGTGNLRITGLPFTSESGNRLHPVSIYNSDITLTALHVIQAYVQSNQARIDMFSYPTGGGAAANVAMDTAGTLVVSGHYKVNH